MSPTIKRLTVPQLRASKAEGRKVCMLTAYDYPIAELLDRSGVDAILVGDSLANVVQGRRTTVPVTLEEIIYHGEMVVRAVKRAVVVVDMPFLTYHVGKFKAIENAGRILKETGCQAVKLEGSADQAEVVAALSGAGIPVMAHVGLRPQSINQLGSFRVQRDRDQLLHDAQAVEAAGAFAIVMECLPSEIASDVTAAVSVPTIGIGAGLGCDGQVLVTHDMLGLTSGYIPRFVKRFADLQTVIEEAVGSYCDAVRNGSFPGDEQTYK